MGGRAVLLIAMAAFGGGVMTAARAAGASPGAGRIAFYGDIGNVVSSRNPLLVRPSLLLLAEDGSVALVQLRWIGWGESIAKATGVWSASNCIPSCAAGKLTTRPARLTLSSPGSVEGHRVYRCFQVAVVFRPRNGVRQCLRRQGGFYFYAPVTGLQADRGRDVCRRPNAAPADHDFIGAVT